MALPPAFLDELRARLTLSEVIQRRVRLTRHGREFMGLCPFHNEKSPSFTVNDEKGFFHCFGCGAHGDVIGFVMRDQNLGFREAVESLAGEAGLDMPRPDPRDEARAQQQQGIAEAMAAAAAFYEGQLAGMAGREARDYLAGRGLDAEAARRFRLGFAPDGRGLLKQALLRDFPEPLLIEAGLLRRPDDGRESYDYFRDRVMFPILDRTGRVIAFGGRVMGDAKPKYLNSPETPLFHKGRVLYGHAWARAGVGKGAELIVTEGYMDVIALHRAGFEGAVAPLGTALTEEQLETLWKLAPEPVLCFDGDAAGQRAAARALDRALPGLKPGKSLRFAVIPGGEDPDSLIGKLGRAAMQRVLEAARPLVDVLFEQEFASRPTDTPERRADLLQRLDARAGSIANEILSKEYRFTLQRMMRDRLRPPRVPFAPNRGGGNTSRRKTANRRLGPQEDFATVATQLDLVYETVGRQRQEIILALVLTHPDLLDGHIEEFAEIELAAPDLDKLRHAILNLHAAQMGLDADSIRHHLSLSGWQDEIERLLDRQTLAHADFAAGKAATLDPDMVRLGWLQAIELWRAHCDRAAEYAAMLAQFHEAPTEANWTRILELQRQIEGEQVKQAEFDGMSAAWTMPETT